MADYGGGGSSGGGCSRTREERTLISWSSWSQQWHQGTLFYKNDLHGYSARQFKSSINNIEQVLIPQEDGSNKKRLFALTDRGLYYINDNKNLKRIDVAVPNLKILLTDINERINPKNPDKKIYELVDSQGSRYPLSTYSSTDKKCFKKSIVDNEGNTQAGLTSYNSKCWYNRVHIDNYYMDCFIISNGKKASYLYENHNGDRTWQVPMADKITEVYSNPNVDNTIYGIYKTGELAYFKFNSRKWATININTGSDVSITKVYMIATHKFTVDDPTIVKYAFILSCIDSDNKKSIYTCITDNPTLTIEDGKTTEIFTRSQYCQQFDVSSGSFKRDVEFSNKIVFNSCLTNKNGILYIAAKDDIYYVDSNSLVVTEEDPPENSDDDSTNDPVKVYTLYITKANCPIKDSGAVGYIKILADNDDLYIVSQTKVETDPVIHSEYSNNLHDVASQYFSGSATNTKQKFYWDESKTIPDQFKEEYPYSVGLYNPTNKDPVRNNFYLQSTSDLKQQISVSQTIATSNLYKLGHTSNIVSLSDTTLKIVNSFTETEIELYNSYITYTLMKYIDGINDQVVNKKKEYNFGLSSGTRTFNNKGEASCDLGIITIQLQQKKLTEWAFTQEGTHTLVYTDGKWVYDGVETTETNQRALSISIEIETVSTVVATRMETEEIEFNYIDTESYQSDSHIQLYQGKKLISEFDDNSGSNSSTYNFNAIKTIDDKQYLATNIGVFELSGKNISSDILIDFTGNTNFRELYELEYKEDGEGPYNGKWFVFTTSSGLINCKCGDPADPNWEPDWKVFKYGTSFYKVRFSTPPTRIQDELNKDGVDMDKYFTVKYPSYA